MKSKFDFQERVKILAKEPGTIEINGAHGVVKGKAQYDGDKWYYAVAIDCKNGEVWSVEEYELETLGELIQEDSELKEKVRVLVDGDGKGHIKKE